MKSKITLFRFDLIRILAMVFVIGTHFDETFGSMGIRASCLHVYMGKGLLYSQMGVVLFILMSGSLSAASLERSLSDNGVLERKSVLRYYKKRLLSVLPLYYMAYVMAYVIKVAPKGVAVHKAMIWTLFGLDGYLTRFNVPTVYLVGEWFIGMILICYLLCPLLYHFIRKYPRITFCVLVIYYVLIVTCYPLAGDMETDVLIRIFDFAVGMYFGVYIKKISGMAAAVCAALTVLLCFWEPDIEYMYLIIIRGVSFYCVLWFLGDWIETFSAEPVVKARKVCSKWAQYSFAVYMIHKIVIDQVLSPFAGYGVDGRGYIRLMVYAGVLMIALGIVLYSAEKHMIQKITACL